jgi:hypothetical protein
LAVRKNSLIFVHTKQRTMKSLHFLMIYNADGIDHATELAKRELDGFGLRNIGTADWYEIGSVVKDDESAFTTPTFDRPVYTAKLANEQVEKWILGIYTDEMMAVVKKIDNNAGASDLTFEELCLVSRYYENKLAAQNYRRKFYNKPFDIVKGSELNAGLYDEFGASWIVNSLSNENFIVAVYKK